MPTSTKNDGGGFLYEFFSDYYERIQKGIDFSSGLFKAWNNVIELRLEVNRLTAAMQTLCIKSKFLNYKLDFLEEKLLYLHMEEDARCHPGYTFINVQVRARMDEVTQTMIPDESGDWTMIVKRRVRKRFPMTYLLDEVGEVHPYLGC